MKKHTPIFVIVMLILILALTSSRVYSAYDAGKHLEEINRYLYPAALQKEEGEVESAFSGLGTEGEVLGVRDFLCSFLGEIFKQLCTEAVSTQPVYVVSNKRLTVNDIGEDSKQENEASDQHGYIKGAATRKESSKGAVLADQDDTAPGIIKKATIDKEKGFVASLWPEFAPKAYADDPKRGIKELAGKLLMPASLQLKDFTPSNQPTETVQPQPTLPPYTVPSATTSESLRELIYGAANWGGIPWQVLEAILIIEGSNYTKNMDINNLSGGVFSLTPEQIALYQQPNQQAPVNCFPNICSAAGPYQMTTMGCEPFDTCDSYQRSNLNADCNRCPAACTYHLTEWSRHKDTISQAVNDKREPNVCNLLDSSYAAVSMLKDYRSTRCGNIAGGWNSEAVVKCVARSYYGSCTPCRQTAPGSGGRVACDRLGKTYCDFVWDYYQLNSDVQPIRPTDTILMPTSFVPEDEIISAVDMVDGIADNCVYEDTRGRITRVNRSCVDNILPPLNAEAVEDIKISARAYSNLQCVGYTRATVEQVSNEELVTSSAIPAAVDFATNWPEGYTFIDKGPNNLPQPGDLVIWNSGAYGHIAYVSRINNAKRRLVQVTEANWGTPGLVQDRVVSLDFNEILGWLTKIR